MSRRVRARRRGVARGGRHGGAGRRLRRRPASRPPADASAHRHAPSSAAPTCGTAPVTMNALLRDRLPAAQGAHQRVHQAVPERQVQHPRGPVRGDHAERAAGPRRTNPPDLIRLPQVSELVKDGLLKNLDGYAKAFGWDKWPASQLVQLRVGPGGRPRGEGSLYAMGLNYSMTGVFYNKKLAAQIGMTAAAGHARRARRRAGQGQGRRHHADHAVQRRRHRRPGVPAAEPDGRLRPAGPINDWIFQKPGATIDTPANLQATQHLEQWIKAGYFPKDANALDYADDDEPVHRGQRPVHVQRRLGVGQPRQADAGQRRLLPDAAGAGRAASTRRCRRRSPSASPPRPSTPTAPRSSSTGSPPTRRRARSASQVGGSHPVGPADAYMPAVARGHGHREHPGRRGGLGEDNGAMDFIANATGGIFAKAGRPQLQKLVAGQQTPRGLLKAVQADYADQVEGS